MPLAPNYLDLAQGKPLQASDVGTLDAADSTHVQRTPTPAAKSPAIPKRDLAIGPKAAAGALRGDGT